jgi:hypothetical protein
MGMLYLYFLHIYTHTHTHITFTWVKNFPDPMCSTHSSFSRRRFFHFANSINDDSSPKTLCWLADVRSLPLSTQLSHSHNIKKCISGDGSLRMCNILHIKQTSTVAHNFLHTFCKYCYIQLNQQFSCYKNSLQDMSRSAVKTLNTLRTGIFFLSIYHKSLIQSKVTLKKKNPARRTN